LIRWLTTMIKVQLKCLYFRDVTKLPPKIFWDAPKFRFTGLVSGPLPEMLLWVASSRRVLKRMGGPSSCSIVVSRMWMISTVPLRHCHSSSELTPPWSHQRVASVRSIALWPFRDVRCRTRIYIYIYMGVPDDRARICAMSHQATTPVPTLFIGLGFHPHPFFAITNS
jgi:hypothetical protein